MPTREPDPSRSARRAWLLAALVLVAPGCSLVGPLKGDAEVTAEPLPSRAVARGISAALDARAEALVAGDAKGFLRTVAGTDVRQVAVQRQYFDNVSRLPVGELSYRLRRSTLTSTGEGYAAVVAMRMRLDGYDAEPVVRRSRFSFALSGTRWLVTAQRDPAWDRRHDADLQPWDSGEIVVESGAGVLGVFDVQSQARGAAVVDAVEQGIAEVSAVVPHEWSRQVVVYALSDTSMLAGIDNLPGPDPERLDAVAFPVPAREGGAVVASTRFLLHPRMLESGPDQLARLVRHELTHIALGVRDDRAPVWLSEGLAEWVSVQPVPPSQRVVSGAALAAAQGGDLRLPRNHAFNGPAAAVNYGVSWWACQTIVDMYGESMLWTLLDRLADTPAQQQEEVLEAMVGMDEERLADEAARRLVATYG